MDVYLETERPDRVALSFDRRGCIPPGAPRGGILNQGGRALDGVVVAGNQAVGDPGAIVHVNAVFNIAGGAVGGVVANFGTLTVTGCTFSDNATRGADDTDASALPFFAFPGNALGSGLTNFGVAAVDATQFNGNQALAGSRGLGAFAAIGGRGAGVGLGDDIF